VRQTLLGQLRQPSWADIDELRGYSAEDAKIGKASQLRRALRVPARRAARGISFRRKKARGNDMSILIVGAGATGGYYGGRLARAGRDVTFLVRERRAAALRQRGLRIVSSGSTEVIEPNVVTAAELAAGAGRANSVSTVLVTVKAAGLDAAIGEMAPAVGPETTVVPVLNGMRHMDILNAAFGSARVLGGVALLATQLDGNGDIDVLSPDARITIGAQDRRRTPAVERTRELLDGAGFPVAISDDIVADMWSKWVFIASVGAATCLLGGTAGEIAAAGGDAIARAIVEEAGLAAAASGYPIPDTAQKRTQAMLTAPGSPFASSMYRDLRQGRPVEVDTILDDLLERGRRDGVRTPLLEAAAVALRVHNDRLASPA
jgi:2-dehydropantoate 2-reductase